MASSSPPPITHVSTPSSTPSTPPQAAPELHHHAITAGEQATVLWAVVARELSDLRSELRRVRHAVEDLSDALTPAAASPTPPHSPDALERRERDLAWTPAAAVAATAGADCGGEAEMVIGESVN